MRAVVLAAGRGTRLGGLGEETPKGLIEVGGRPLLERSLDAMRAHGVRSFTIVTGHLEDRIRERLEAGDVAFVTNDRYAETGSAASLLVALETTAPPFLLVESDLIYDAAILHALRSDEAQIVTVDASGSGDEVFVYVDPDDLLVALGKGMEAPPGATAAGELAGITWVSAPLAAAFQAAMAETPADHYEEIFARCAASVPITVTHVPGKAWREVDTPADLAAAEAIAATL